MSGQSPRPGRVAADKMFEPSVRKRRLVQNKPENTTADAAKTAEAGAWLRSLREQAGMSQSQMVTALGLKHRAAVSMIESGKNRMLPPHFETFAAAVGIDRVEFVKRLMSYYSPEVYDILFKESGGSAGKAAG